MDNIETVITCPLGSKCREVKDNKIHQCAWLVKLAGRNPQTGEEMDEEGCAMHWTPVLLIENANTNRGQTAAIESFRNETVQQAQTTNQILAQAAQQRVAEQFQLQGSGINSKWQ
jgi:hypothetical protein